MVGSGSLWRSTLLVRMRDRAGNQVDNTELLDVTHNAVFTCGLLDRQKRGMEDTMRTSKSSCNVGSPMSAKKASSSRWKKSSSCPNNDMRLRRRI
eukprot:1630478-Amphidinium_carterae.1